MLSYLRLKNFKSFSDITLDLRGPRKVPKKTAFIYGENGSGKSNLMLAMLFLTECMESLHKSKKLPNLSKTSPLSTLFENMTDTDKLELLNLLSQKPLEERIADYKMIGRPEPMELEFGFNLNGHEGSYCMHFDENQVIFEELRYLIGKREGTIFSLANNRDITLSPSIFLDNAYKNELEKSIERFWGKHTFLAILVDQQHSNNHPYMEERLGTPLFIVLNWLRGLSVWHKGYSNEIAKISVPLRALSQLSHGTINDNNHPELRFCENLLNTIFTNLYSDIKSAYYQFTVQNERYKYELYFKKLIDGRIIDIPLTLESTGTQKLMAVLPALLSAVMGSTVFIDEIDSGIHDLLMKNIIDLLGESCKGQLVITTHNTLLLEDYTPENIYIINIDAQGNKAINCVSDYAKRTQKTHNMQKRYLRGDYNGIPFVGDFDFDDAFEDALADLEEHQQAEIFAKITGGL